MADEIARLIGLLDDDSTEVAEDAKAELIAIGSEAVQPLAATVGSLDRYGQLSAIEVFEQLGDLAAGPVLIDLLGSAHETVREWSAWAISEFGVRDAVPTLRAAYQRQRASGAGPDWSEAVAIRRALTVLGGRTCSRPWSGSVVPMSEGEGRGDEAPRESMTGGAVDTVALAQLWDERWPGCSKLSYELRAARDRWVRFHTLPGSKRYPETEDEYGIVLARHNTVLAELVTGPEVLVVTAGYSDSPEPQEPCRSPETVAVHPDAAYWTSVCMDDEPGFESWTHLYVSPLAWSAGCLDVLLRQVADDVIGNVLLAGVGLRWLYHPYDGGMDVILSSPGERDALRDQYRDWLSAYPSGL